MIGQIVSHYKILEKLGGGGMGVVYKAEDTKLHRTVALKFLPPELTRDEEAKKRFIQEAQTASSLQHHNICNIHDIDETRDGQIFICMDCYEGETLKKKIERGPLKTEDAIDIFLQVAAGLQKANEKGIIHRDIKPANIFITNDRVVKILDFGLAKLSGQTMMTKMGETVGTIAYMSPEQTRGDEVDFRSDIWSSGVVLFEMITGQLPFKRDYEQAVIYSILNEKPKPIKDMKTDTPVQIDKIIQRMLEKDSNNRYQRFDEIISELQTLTKVQISNKNNNRKKLPILWLIGSIIIIAIIVFAYLFILKKPDMYLNKSIAVLPFKNLSDSKEDEYFSDGITDDVIAQLSKISELKVISRTSMMQYKGMKKNVREIGEELDVATVLEGSVCRVGNQVRIVAQLIDAKNEGHLWAETYDKEMIQIFEVQSDVARKIAVALETRLSEEEKIRIDKKATENLEAYGFYLRGREYYNQYDNDDNEKAIDMFKKAIELDKKYALAYAGLADAYAQRTQRFGFDEFWIDSAITLSKKAITLDNNIAEPYKALGLGYAVKGWYKKALFEYLKAVKINPNFSPAVTNIGGLYAFTGNWYEAYKWYKKALILSPNRASSYRLFGYMYIVLLNDSLAEFWYKKTLELQPGYHDAISELSKLYVMKGDFQKARNLINDNMEETDLLMLINSGDIELSLNNFTVAKNFYEKALKISSYEDGGGLELAFILNKLGKKNEADKILNKLFDFNMGKIKQGNEDFSYRYNLARIYSIQGNKEEALNWLQKSIDSGYWMVREIEKDLLMDKIRDDGRFKKIISQLRSDIKAARIKVEKLEKES